MSCQVVAAPRLGHFFDWESTTHNCRRDADCCGGETAGSCWRSSPDLCVKAEEAPRLRLGCLGDLLFLEE